MSKCFAHNLLTEIQVPAVEPKRTRRHKKRHFNCPAVAVELPLKGIYGVFRNKLLDTRLSLWHRLLFLLAGTGTATAVRGHGARLLRLRAQWPMEMATKIPKSIPWSACIGEEIKDTNKWPLWHRLLFLLAGIGTTIAVWGQSARPLRLGVQWSIEMATKVPRFIPWNVCISEGIKEWINESIHSFPKMFLQEDTVRP